LRIPSTLEDELTLPEPITKKEQKKLSQKNFRSSPDGVIAQAEGQGTLQTTSAALGEQVSASAAVEKVAPKKTSKGQAKVSAE
jgi:hypothetical protein